MKKCLIVILVVILFFSGACGNKVEKSYYDSGQIKEQRSLNARKDTLNYYVVQYYRNGQKKSEGRIVNGNRDGYWEEWYGDGDVKWRGDYLDGVREHRILTDIKSSIMFSDNVLIKGKETYLRIVVEGIHPEDFISACSNGVFRRLWDNDNFNYVIIPEKPGNIRFYFFLSGDNKMRLVGVDTLKVVD